MGVDAEVIVVGGGPAGAATAFHLARAGADVLVLDRARFPRDKPCGEYLSPQAASSLHEMGVLDAVEAAGAARLAGMRVVAPSGVALHGEFVADHGFRGYRDYGLALRRPVLDQLLLDAARAAGARIIEGARVADLERVAGAGGRVSGVMAHMSDGTARVLRAPMVVGADGLRSVTARRAGLGRHGRWPARVALVSHYHGVHGVGDCGEMHVFDGGYVGVADVGGGATNVSLVVSARESPSMAGDAAAYLERRLAALPALHARLTGATRITPVRAVGTFNWRARRAWLPGLALVGDAADFFDPFTGEGIYTALRGGALLAPFALRAARASAPRAAGDVLREYDRARWREFSGKWKVERAIGVAVSFPLLINHAARAMHARKSLADLLVGVSGDFVPPREVLRTGYVARLILAGFGRPRGDTASRDARLPVPDSQ